MIHVKDAALELLAAAVVESELGEEESIRLLKDDSGDLAITVDRRRDEDRVLHQDGRAVLLLDPAIDDELAAATLDVAGEGADLHLTINRTS